MVLRSKSKTNNNKDLERWRDVICNQLSKQMGIENPHMFFYKNGDVNRILHVQLVFHGCKKLDRCTQEMILLQSAATYPDFTNKGSVVIYYDIDNNPEEPIKIEHYLDGECIDILKMPNIEGILRFLNFKSDHL